MSTPFCVNTKGKDFLDIKLHFRTTARYMENLIKQWNAETGFDDYSLDNSEFVSFIERKLNIGTTVEVSDAEVFKEMAANYGHLNGSDGFTARMSKRTKEVIVELKDLFGDENVSVIEIPIEGEDNIVKIRTARPVMGKSKGKSKRNSAPSVSVSISKTGYRKGDPQKNPDVDFIFTENAQAAAASGKISGTKASSIYEGLDDSDVKLSVSDVNGTNQAGIRTDRTGRLSKNAYGIVVKKYQQDSSKRFVTKKGQFEDTNEDFELFKKVNTEMFERLDVSGNRKKVFPSQMALGKAALPKRFAEWLHDELYSRYGIRSTVRKNENGSYDGYGLSIDSVAKPGESRDASVEAKKQSRLDEAIDAVESLRETARKNIRFDKETHTYYVNGEKVPISVTTFTSGEQDFGAWGTPSTSIGNTFDTVTRDFFEGKLRGKYPNLTATQLNNLVEDLKGLRKYFDSLYGTDKEGNPRYRVFTSDDLRVAGQYTVMDKKGKPVKKMIAGSMDMMVAKDDGTVDIYDMKTSRSAMDQSKIAKYTRQLSVYKALVETSIPSLKGKIDKIALIPAKVSYPHINDVEYTEENGQLKADGKKVQSLRSYKGPRIALDTLEDYELDAEDNVNGVEFESVWSSLSQEEKESLREEFGQIEKKAERKPVEKKPVQTSSDTRNRPSGLYDNPLLSASEIRFLGDYVMRMTSRIITNLQTGAEVYDFSKDLPGVDFTRLDRKEIINTVGIGRIFKHVRDNIMNPDKLTDVEDFDILDKYQIAYDNFGELTQSAYHKLISLEGVTVVDAAPEDIVIDGVDDGVLDNNDTGTLEEREREYWQVGVRNISAKNSLSAEVRRAFDSLMAVDGAGNHILDKFGFGLQTFVDSDVAINSILEWVNECTSIKEMETVLESMADANPWLFSVLELIKEEPFRSKFFQNFRKDFTKYSIVTVEYDEKGNRHYVTTIINTKGAQASLMDNVRNMYATGSLRDIIIPIRGDIEGRGKVNVKQVTAFRDTISNIHEELMRIGPDYKAKIDFLEKYVPVISEMMNRCGIVVNSEALHNAFMHDINKGNINYTTVYKTLGQFDYMFGILLDNASDTQYNPMLKGEHSIWGNYNKIISPLSKFIQDSIESSTFENGKMHYSFTIPSYLGKTILNLKDSLGDPDKFENFMQKEFKDYKFFYDEKNGRWRNEWLRLLETSEEHRNMLDHKVQLSFNKTPYNELSELSYTLSLMSEFFDKNGNGKWAWYRVPILANKPSSEFIRFKRYSGKRYKEQIRKGLHNVVDQEIMRIKTVLERSQNPNVELIGTKGKVCFDINPKVLTPALSKKITEGKLTFNDVVKNGKSIFSGSGAEFKFLPVLNDEIVKRTALGQLILDRMNGKKVNTEEFNELLDTSINTAMDLMVKSEKQKWRSIGLFDMETVTKTVIEGNKRKKVKQSSYKYLQQLGKTEEEIDEALTEYIWNDMFATINIIQITGTDLAYYKNVEDFQKRWSQIHAPSMKMNVYATDKHGVRYSADGNARTVYLKDFIEVKSEILPNVKKIFDSRIAELKGKEKEDMKIMRDLILQSFEDINVADAQGYSSPSSYRKKMGMLGSWTDEMEEAYIKIRSGNFNANDLGVLWQPLKPFVYTQTSKPSGAKTMSTLKMAIQNKNSEYLLILADALMRSGNQINKLSAIYDVMEESAYDNGKYNGIGIDTVQFMSAVNVGSMGVIDINNAESVEEIRQILEDHIYSDSEEDGYNSQYVHKFSFEDYGIQQEVPAHLQDHEQLMGSQVRILSVSDITPGTVFDVYGRGKMNDKQLLDEYFNLHAANIRDSFRQLEKEFKLTGTRAERNEALSRILRNSILKDQRYGPDLLRACKLDPVTKEFVIPMNDPIQSMRIQQLVNSVIKKNINKQTIKGGPVVQASVFGFSDDLHIVFNDDGSVKHWECYMPVPSADLEEALTKDDGSLMTVEEALAAGVIDEEMLKAIAYRIPTEDKYSIMPLRIKGFVPKTAGEVIVLPKEVTKTSGSDFDIDKMYVMLKAFEAKVFKPERKTVNSLLTETLKKDTSMTKAGIRAFINGRRGADDSAYDVIMAFEQGALPKRVEGTPEEAYVRKQYLYNWYVQNKRKIRRKNSFTLIDDESRDGRNNRIFDIQYAVLTNLDTADKQFNPGSFDPQKKIARIVTIMKSNPGKYTYEQLSRMALDKLTEMSESSSNLNICLPTTQVYFHKQNMTAGKLIGIFANNNTSHAFLSMQDIRYNLRKFEEFTFNGVEVTGSQNNRLDEIKGHDGSYISKNIAGFLAASVDAVKDPVLNFLNLNTMTTGPAMVLTRLGFDVDSVGLFISQPVLEYLSQEYFKRNNEGYISVDSLIDEILDKYKDSGMDMKVLESNLRDTEFTKEELAKGLSGKDRIFQARVLLLFKKLTSMSGDLNSLTFLTKFNSVTNAVGPSIADTLVMQEKYRRFIDKMEREIPPFNSNAKKVLENNPMLKAFYDTTVSDQGASKRIFQEYFPHYTAKFTDILNLLNRSVKGTLDSKIINSLVSDFMYYKLTNDFIDGSFDNRAYMINDYVDDYLKESSGIENSLLKVVKIKASDKKCPVKTLEARTGGFNIDVQEKVKGAWSDLIRNPETNELAQSLFKYNIVRSGFMFSPKTFLHLASVEVKLGVDGYIDNIADPTLNNNLVNNDSFLIQYLRNHVQNKKLVPEYTGKATVSRKEDVITFQYKNMYEMSSITIDENSTGDKFAKVIWYNEGVYVKVPQSEAPGMVKYVRSSPLGNQNNFLEYDIHSSALMESAVGISGQTKEQDSEYEQEKEEQSEQSEEVTPEDKGFSIQGEEVEKKAMEAIFGEGFFSDIRKEEDTVDKAVADPKRRKAVKEEVKKATKNRCK